MELMTLNQDIRFCFQCFEIHLAGKMRLYRKSVPNRGLKYTMENCSGYKSTQRRTVVVKECLAKDVQFTVFKVLIQGFGFIVLRLVCLRDQD
jgi:hypothetical protein